MCFFLTVLLTSSLGHSCISSPIKKTFFYGKKRRKQYIVCFTMLISFLRFLAFHGCIFYESLLHKYGICRVVEFHPREPKSVRAHVIFSPVMIAFIGSIRHSSMIRNNILAKGSVACPTIYSFVTLRLLLFFYHHETVTLLLYLLSSSMVHVNSSLTVYL